MESSVERSDSIRISKHSRSLDLQSLYVDKTKLSAGGDGIKKQGSSLGGRGVKREHGSSHKEWDPYAQAKKRKKGKKEVPLSSFETCIGISKEGDGDSFPSASLDPKKVGSKLNGFVLEEKKLNAKKYRSVPSEGNLPNYSISSHSLEDNNVKSILKRPRHVFGRKKIDSNHVGKPAISSGSKRVTSLSNSSSRSSSEVHKSKLTSGKYKKKKILDEFKHDGLGKTISCSSSKEEQGAVQLSGASVAQEASGRGLHSRRRRLKSVVENQTVKASNAKYNRAFKDYEDDDQENLEQNAARMLSSRFDPSCTGFCSNASESTTQSVNESSFCPINRKGRRPSDGAQGRVLRPRNQRKQKGLVRKRRHFYELNVGNVDPYLVINKRIKVYWPLDQSWYFGLVKNYEPTTKLHHVKYDDRDEEWINLQNERFKLLLLPTEKTRLEEGLRDTAGDVGPVNPVGDNDSGGFMDSETIISWLARSNHRVKTSSLKKQNKSSSLRPVLSENSGGTPGGCLDVGLSKTGNRLLENPLGYEGKDIRDVAEWSMMAFSNNRKVSLVYYRRRYRKREQRLDAVPGDKFRCEGLARSGSENFLQYEYDGGFQHCNVKELNNSDGVWWDGESFAYLKLSLDPVKGKLVSNLPLRRVFKWPIGAKYSWLCSSPPQNWCSTVMILWPQVLMEMLFVDNHVGLRFLLFEGCLMQAVEFLCMILSAFHRSNENGKLVDLQLPVTSIKFKLSGFRDLSRELVFVFYSFLELKNSLWEYLDNKLKHHCRIMKELSRPECTYANIRILEEGRDKRSGILSPGTRVSPEVMVRRSKHGVTHLDCLSCYPVDKFRRLPPFVLSFSAAHRFFLSLQLKLLMENVASIRFHKHDETGSKGGLENSIPLTGHDSSFFEGFSGHVPGIKHTSRCVRSKVETDVFRVNSDGDQMKSKFCPSSEANAVETSVGDHGSGKLERSPIQVGSWQCGESQAFSSVPGEQCLPNRSETGCFTCCLNASHGQDEGSAFYREASNTQESLTDLACAIHSPKPTGPRSAWHRNRIGSISSFGYRSKLWSDGRSDFFHGGLANGTQKPRSPASYLLPFGGYEFGSKPRSHHRRGRPYKRIKTDSGRWTTDGSESPLKDPEAFSCNANILIIVGDRGWRECGALVVLEMVDHKDWRLLVKSSGVTKYSHKAHQFLQPAITNRYTHAIMWKGGKDWTLEFMDRSQWNLFKEMHEQCYNRNIRAALVKNIPIPGVRVVEDSDDNVVEVPFVRSSPKYYRQAGTEVELALDPSRVVYDLDSDDEEFISRMRNSSNTEGNKPTDISGELFEKIMDMFEKVSYARQLDGFNDDEIEQFMGGLGPEDLVKAIHEHWQQKRKRKGMPLIRQFQPALWEHYQQQLKKWELALSKMPSFSNGFKENVLQKPPMFAFCLRPRGLEVPNKGSKQRSQRKFTGHNGTFSRDQDGIQVLSRKLNGFYNGEERSVLSYHSHESDASLCYQSSPKLSPRDASWSGVISMNSGRSERNQHSNLLRSKSKKMGVYTSYGDSTVVGGVPGSQRSFGKRNGVSRYNMGLPEWPSVKHQYIPDGFQRHRVEQIGGLDYDEFRLRDASSAAQHATNMAKLKREKAQRLLHRAEVALHKAAVALMTADAMKASEKELIGDG